MPVLFGGPSNRDQKSKCSVVGRSYKDIDCRDITGICLRCSDLNHRIAQSLLPSTDSNARPKPQEASTSPAGCDCAFPTGQSREGRPRTQGCVHILCQQDI